MEISELIARINILAKKKRTVGLSTEEQAEQKELYAEYLAMIRCQVKTHLDNIGIVDSPTVKH